MSENITSLPEQIQTPALSKESAQFLYNLLADQAVKVGNPDAQATVYMATRALSELEAILKAAQT